LDLKMSEAPISQAFTDKSVRLAQIANPQSDIVHFNDPLPLDCGGSLGSFSIAYQTYGTLNEARSNVILVCHALTGDQHVANIHPVTGKPGWWDTMVGPGKPIDTDRYFVLCPNVLGGCMGSTGPSSINPVTGTPYGPDFPVITIGDMVRAQARLLDHLRIPDLLSVLGGSMGGMQVLEWAAEYKDRVYSAVPIACAARHSSQNIAFHEVGRQAVMADPEWCQGRYLDEGRSPRKGLAVARMAAHITYLSDDALHEKFGRSLQDRDKITFGFDADFQVESYLRHQGLSFVDRFDANSYLYITRAMDYFDIAADHDGVLANAFAGTKTRFCLISFTSDWLFPTEESREIVHALNAVAANVSFVEIKSNKGHDTFLLNEPELFATIRGFLSAAANQRGVAEAGGHQ
jgi:homoserine O-acetyltransferase/O-succinyltransferase